MKLFLCILTAYAVGGATAHAQTAAPDMLSDVIPAVVTIGVERVEIERVRGFGQVEKDSLVRTAYSRRLNLGRTMGLGSGFLIERKGRKYVVTNMHVAASVPMGEEGLIVYTYDQKKYKVVEVGGDSFYDIAVLAFVNEQPGAETRTVDFKKKPLRIGESVYSVGNPGGRLPYTVTDGIISAVNRGQEGVVHKFGYVQSTATIFHGNSGGPLVDAEGRVAGVNTLREFLKSRIGNEWQPQINYALEAPLALRIVDDILADGRLRRSFLGIEIAQRYIACPACWTGIEPMDSLVWVVGSIPGSPAAAALSGREGAAIRSINKQRVYSIDEVLSALENSRPGETVAVELLKGGRSETISLPSRDLTDQQLGDIARYIVGKYSEATPALATNGGLGIRYRTPRVLDEESSEELGDEEETREHRKRTRKPDHATIPQSTIEWLPISAAGIDNQQWDVSEGWGVATESELGAALRLAIYGGGYSLVGPGEPREHQWLSRDEDVQQRTVVY